MDLLRSPKARILLAAACGLIGYGGWAYIVNLDHGVSAAFKAALTQGGYSFAVTLVLTLLMESVYPLSDKPWLRFNLTCTLTCLMLYATSWGINALVGTPEILLTILPGAVISTVYTVSYTLALGRLNRGPEV